MAKFSSAVAWPLLLCTFGTSLTAFAAAPVAATLPVVGVTFAASVLGNILSGAAGSAFHEISKAFGVSFLEKLFNGPPAISENHVVLLALRRAQLEALATIRQAFDETWKWKDIDPATKRWSDQFSTALGKFIDEQSTPAAILAFAKGESASRDEAKLRQAVLGALPQGWDKGLAMRHATGGTESAEQINAAIEKAFNGIRKTTETAVLAEFQQTLPDSTKTLPEAFTTLFNGSDTSNGWFDFFLRAAADYLKDAENKDGVAFEKIWQAEQSAIIKASLETQIEILREIKVDTTVIRKVQESQVEADDRRHREAMEANEKLLAEQAET